MIKDMFIMPACLWRVDHCKHGVAYGIAFKHMKVFKVRYCSAY